MISLRIKELLDDFVTSCALIFVNPIFVNSDTNSAFAGSGFDISWCGQCSRSGLSSSCDSESESWSRIPLILVVLLIPTSGALEGSGLCRRHTCAYDLFIRSFFVGLRRSRLPGYIMMTTISASLDEQLMLLIIQMDSTEIQTLKQKLSQYNALFISAATSF